MSLISRHFSIDDFRCKDGTRYPIGWEDDRLQLLANMMDAIRDQMGEAIVVVCGYRTLAYNKALREESLRRNGGTSGVAIHSQHTEGRAADIRPLKANQVNIATLHDVTLQMYADGKIPELGGLGYYRGLWIHVDTRPKEDGQLVRWDGSGTGQDK